MNILPLFPSVFVEEYLSDDFQFLIEDSRKIKFNYTNNGNPTQSSLGHTKRVLEKFPTFSKKLLSIFNNFSEEVLEVKTKFIITTSWYTKCSKGTSSHFHNHKNSFYSGILYFDEYDSDSGGIEFYTPLEAHKCMMMESNTFDIYNSNSMLFKPNTGKLILFPSYIQHRIHTHESSKDRYSLAFNIHPSGSYGIGDSFIDTNWFN